MARQASPRTQVVGVLSPRPLTNVRPLESQTDRVRDPLAPLGGYSGSSFILELSYQRSPPEVVDRFSKHVHLTPRTFKGSNAVEVA